MEIVNIDVVFKKDKNDGEIVAFFPNEIADNKGNILCYAHIGQHSAASIAYMKECLNASIDEFADLALELHSIGYELNIKNN